MSLHHAFGVLGGACVLLGASWAQAQCSKDTDCKDNRICADGSCVAPHAATPATSTPAAPPPAPAATPATPGPRLVRHNQSMMVTGIVLVAASPVALLVAGIAGFGKALCQIDNDHPASCQDYDPALYGSLLATAALVGVGVPLLVIGARKEPASAALRATLQPWATTTGGGFALRLDL